MHTIKRGVVAVLIASTIALTGCNSPAASPPEVTTPPPATGTPTPTPPPTPEAERGTRANPLAVGETRKIADNSMWTVGAEGPTQVSDGFVVLPLRLVPDWVQSQANFTEGGGGNVADVGVDPWQALIFEYVTAGGRSYNSWDTYSDSVTNLLYEVGTMYPPTDGVSANVPISVPSDEIPGGVWVVKNTNGNQVFIASQ